jgi:hypothetical protein
MGSILDVEIDQGVHPRCRRAADLVVVERVERQRLTAVEVVPGVLPRLGLDRIVAAQRERQPELSGAGQRCRVRLQLEMALVLVPVRDVDHEDDEDDQHGQPDREPREDRAPVGADVRSQVRHAGHPSTPV